MKIKFTDNRALPTQRKFKDNGQMIAPVVIAVPGVMEYRASECGPNFADRDPDSIVKIHTSEEVLFDEASIESYRSAPITLGHPEDDVTSENAKDLMKGHLEGMPFRDEDSLKGTIVLNDADTIAIVKAGVVDVSTGYTCSLEMSDSAEYDAVKKDIRVNHIAIVKHGRNKVASISDEDSVKTLQDEKPADQEEKTYSQEYVDGLEAKLNALQEKVDASQTLLDAAKKDTTEEVVAKKVKELLELCVEARTHLSDEEMPSLDAVEIKRKVLEKALGKTLEGKSEAYINVRYDIFRDEGIEGTSVSDALSQDASFVPEAKVSRAEESRARMISRNSKL